MNIEQLVNLDNEIITLEQFEELEQSELVESIEHNGTSGYYYGKRWYTVYLNDDYISDNCDDSHEIQVYI